LPMSRKLRKERFPIAVAIEPLSLRPLRSSDVTLWCLLLQDMPIQLQTWVPFVQFFDNIPFGSEVIWALKAKRAASSVEMFDALVSERYVNKTSNSIIIVMETILCNFSSCYLCGEFECLSFFCFSNDIYILL